MNDDIALDASQKNRLEQLRKQALAALKKGEQFNVSLTQEDTLELHSLLEELRIYQAELEIQNEQLIDTVEQKELLKQHYANLFNSSPFPMLLLSKQAKILESNSSADSTLDEIFNTFGSNFPKLGQSLYNVLEKNTALEFNTLLNECEISARPAVFSVKLKRRPDLSYTGTVVPVKTRTDSPESADPNFILILRDMTAEEKLALERKIFEKVIDQNQDIILVIDQDRKLLSANNHARYTFQDNNQRISWKNICMRLPEELIVKIEELLDSQNLFRRNETVLHHFQGYLTSDEKNQYYLAKMVQIDINETGDRGVSIFISDETERLKLDKELKVALSIYDMSTQAILITDEKRKITYVNHAFELITGYSERESMGKNASFLSSGRHQRNFYHKMWSDIKNKAMWAGEIWNKRKSGDEYPQWLTITRYPKEGKLQNYIATFTDISDQIASQKKIHDLAYYDPLTGAGNRRLLKQHIDERVSGNAMNDPFCIMYVDLDRFKSVNDTLGHEVGDSLLNVVVRRISNALRDEDRIYRLGGDEFLIVIDDLSKDDAERIALKLTQMLESPFFIKTHEVAISSSIGITMYPEDGETFDDLLTRADLAMYQVKSDGKNGFRFFDTTLLDRIDKEMSLEQYLRKALSENTLYWEYQPQIRTTDRGVWGYEAVLRLQEPEIKPDVKELVEVAEKSGLVHELTQRALASALSLLSTLDEEQEIPRISINLSALDFSKEAQFKKLIAILHDEPELAKYVDFEITESIMMLDEKNKIEQLNQLKDVGASIHIDDFGTGYSSLAYLAEFPIDLLKVDKRFVHQIGQNSKAESICKSVILLSKQLDILSLAEGVETQQQLDFLTQNGCDLVQGYLIGKPSPKLKT